MKIPLTPAGIELATFRFVAQHLDHCATAVPHLCKVPIIILEKLEFSRQIIKKI